MIARNRALVTSCAFAFLAGCVGGDADSLALAVRTDSGGVEIIEYSQAALAAAPLYGVSDSSDISIGVMDGEEPYVFGRISAAAQLSDGTIAVFDRSAMELRFFAPDGRFIKLVGAPGEGPREFGGTDGWWLGAGDTLRAWDDRLSRLVTIADLGEYFETTPVRPENRRPGYYLGSYADGSLLFLRTGGERLPDGSRITFESVIRLHPPRSESSWPEDTLYWQSEPSEGETPMGLFNTRETAGFHPRGVWFTSGAEPQIEFYDTTGVLRRIVRWEEADRTVRPEHIETYIESVLEGQPRDSRARVRASLEQRPVPERFASADAVVSNDDGRVWVLLFERPGETLDGRFLVFSPDGALEARVTLWDGIVEPLPRSLGTLMTQATDAAGAPIVERHRFVRVK